MAESALEKRGIHPPDDLRPLALGVPHAWLLTSARYFQTLGFYAEYLDLPDAALPDAVREAVRWRWDVPLPPEEAARDTQPADVSPARAILCYGALGCLRPLIIVAGGGANAI